MEFAQELKRMSALVAKEAAGRPHGLERLHLMGLAESLASQARIEARPCAMRSA